VIRLLVSIVLVAIPGGLIVMAVLLWWQARKESLRRW